MEEQTFIKNNIKSFNKNDNNYNIIKMISLKFNFLYFRKKYLYYILIIITFLLIAVSTFLIVNDNIKYKNYINDCKKLKRFNIIKIPTKENPYLSICIPVHNMEKYLERSLLSIINQSFQDYEIVIIDDNSNDNSLRIMKKLQLEDNRIKIIKHSKNLGVYSSRVDAIINSKGKYIILLDPDDMLLNPKLFEILYNYNLNNNLDMIEFSVKYQDDGKNNIFDPESHELNHYHNFGKNIIYQPELSNILFLIPQTKNSSAIICRTVWNKLIRKNIILKSINYLDKDFKNEFLIAADDTPINILNFQNSNNYSNIKVPGYLYNLRTNSISRGKNGQKHDSIVSINYLLYTKFFYRYINDFKKDLNYLFYDMKITYPFLLNIKNYKINNYLSILNSFLREIINNKNISTEFKEFLINLLIDLEDNAVKNQIIP